VIDASKLVLSDLPGVSAESIRDLPETSAVYFIVCGSGVVHYVGQSKRLRSRLKNHRRLAQVENREGLMVRYLAVPQSDLRDVEEACIGCFSPRLNGTYDPRPPVGPQKLDRLNQCLCDLGKILNDLDDSHLRMLGPMWFLFYGADNLGRMEAILDASRKFKKRSEAIAMLTLVFSNDFKNGKKHL
jgi:hypothetical protein